MVVWMALSTSLFSVPSYALKIRRLGPTSFYSFDQMGDGLIYPRRSCIQGDTKACGSWKTLDRDQDA